MPFGEYKDFDDCVSKNQDKESPGGYCADIHKKITGKWPAEENMQGELVPDEQFDPVQLEKGIQHEMEHTDNPEEAKKIAKDHLLEDELYYDHLDQMENEVKQMENELENSGPGGHIPDATGPHGAGMGPGQGKKDGTGLIKNKMDSEIKQKDNPIQENPYNPRNPKKLGPGADIEDKEIKKDETDLMESLDREMKKCEQELDKTLNTKPEPVKKQIDDYLADKKEFLHQTPKFA